MHLPLQKPKSVSLGVFFRCREASLQINPILKKMASYHNISPSFTSSMIHTDSTQHPITSHLLMAHIASSSCSPKNPVIPSIHCTLAKRSSHRTVSIGLAHASTCNRSDPKSYDFYVEVHMRSRLAPRPPHFSLCSLSVFLIPTPTQSPSKPFYLRPKRT